MGQPNPCLAPQRHLMTLLRYQPGSRIPDFHLILIGGYLGLGRCRRHPVVAGPAHEPERRLAIPGAVRPGSVTATGRTGVPDAR
jgi:hypothetical protein